MMLGLVMGTVAAVAPASDDTGYPLRMAELVNQYRASHGLAALTIDPTIAGLAREHSAAMAKAGKLNHDDFPARARRSGLPMCVENVGWNYGSPKAQFEGWRESPGHDRNMLNRQATRVGIGVVAGYVTLIACGA